MTVYFPFFNITSFWDDARRPWSVGSILNPHYPNASPLIHPALY